MDFLEACYEGWTMGGEWLGVNDEGEGNERE